MYNTMQGLLMISGVALTTTVATGILTATKKPEQAELAKLAGLAISGGIVLETLGQLIVATFQTVNLFF